MKKRGKSSYLTVVHFLQIVASQNSALFDMKILSRGHEKRTDLAIFLKQISTNYELRRE